jgi:hypothetical protein
MLVGREKYIGYLVWGFGVLLGADESFEEAPMKRKCSFSMKSLAGALAVATTLAFTLTPKGWAMIAPAMDRAEIGQTTDARAADLKTIQTALESQIVRQRLAEMKLTPAQIEARLSKLSDAQLHQTASRIQTVSAGGDGGGLVITVLLVAVLVALFLYLFRRI